MTDRDIREAVESKRLIIERFDPRSIHPASYDMRLGDEAITSSQREKVNPRQRGLLTVAPGDFALVTTYERVEVPANIAGHLGLRSHYAKKGLVLLSGPQIDPGFRGFLVIGLSNLSPRDVVIPYREPICTVAFYSLDQPVERPYEGEYQDQAGISPRDIENLVEAQGMTFGQVIETLRDLSQNVKSLSDSVAFLKWFFPVALAFGALLISAIVAVINLLTR